MEREVFARIWVGRFDGGGEGRGEGEGGEG